MKLFLSIFFAVSLTLACAEPAPGIRSEVVPFTDVEWLQLNPARGDKSPRAGTLYGDRGEPGPTGFLLWPVDGFESPPHIHNVAYRGVVIRGLIHNDDPAAAKMWMPAGSFWTQPAGESHITAARGAETLAFIEIDDGPFQVRPAAEAFDDGERPVNVDVSNLVWLDGADLARIKTGSDDGPRLAFVWGRPRAGQLNGSLLRLPAGYKGKIRGHGSILRAVVITGRIDYRGPGRGESVSLDPGSYFSATGASTHEISVASGGESMIYIRTRGTFDVM